MLFLKQVGAYTPAPRHQILVAMTTALCPTDQLTGLPARLPFSEAFERLLKDEAGGQVVLCLVDVDWFRVFMDVEGWFVGDRVLLELADELKRVAPAPDLVCRWEKDRFLLAFDVDDSDEVVGWAAELHAAVQTVLTKHTTAEAEQQTHSWKAKRLSHYGHPTTGPQGPRAGFTATVSIVTAGRGDGQTFAQLLDAAESAMHDSKTRGGDRLTVNGRGHRRPD